MLKGKLDHRYQNYLADYKQYLVLRGYGDHVNDWIFFRRGFIECWLQPGFHRFWHVWNPGIGYFVYKLYRLLGGKRHQNLATLAAFFVSGLVHNLVVSMLIFRWDFPLPFTFLAFGIFTVIFRWLERYIKMEKIPVVFHLAINIGLVCVSFDFGFALNDLIKNLLETFFG